MRTLLRSVVLILALFSTATASVHNEIEDALGRVAKLKMMEPGRRYSLLARGETIIGKNDDFLRRREPHEVLASGLSTGCGDHAAAFYSLLSTKNISLLYVQAIELSATSLLERFSGHTAVAVRNPQSNQWILVDPTSSKVLSEKWDPSSEIYRSPAGRFWIGYVGRLEDYSIKTPGQLKNFFRRMLRLVPAAVWDREVLRLEFSTAPMEKSDGSFVNPRYPAFLERYSQVYDDLGLEPKSKVSIKLTDGGPGYGGDCKRIRQNSWKCSVGREAAMNQALFSWIERYIMRQIDE